MGHDTCKVLRKNWSPANIADPDFPNGCEACARQIRKHLGGGDIHMIKPTERRFLGGYMGRNDGWYSHDVVVKDGGVYVAFTGSGGLSVSDFEMQFEYPDGLDFGF